LPDTKKGCAEQGYKNRQRLSQITSFSYDAEFGRYRGTADMAGLAAGPTRSRLTQLRHEQNILLRRTGQQ
jgi:hypothetical protein